MLSTIVFRSFVVVILEVLLWFFPRQWKRWLVYGPAIFIVLAPIPCISLAARTGVGLAAIHGVIHHIWPFIDHAGYNDRHTPFPDVVCHEIMLVYAHYNFIDKFIVRERYAFGVFGMVTVIDVLTGTMLF